MCCKRDILQNPSKYALLSTKVEDVAPSSQALPPQFLIWRLCIIGYYCSDYSLTLKMRHFAFSTLTRDYGKTKPLWWNLAYRKMFLDNCSHSNVRTPIISCDPFTFADGWTSKPTFGQVKILTWLITGIYTGFYTKLHKEIKLQSSSYHFLLLPSIKLMHYKGCSYKSQICSWIFHEPKKG